MEKIHREKNILEKNEVEDEAIEEFQNKFEENAGSGAQILASNITNTRSFEVKTANVVIKVSPEQADLIETKIIDGRPCLVIPVNDNLEVNGIKVNPTLKD